MSKTDQALNFSGGVNGVPKQLYNEPRNVQDVPSVGMFEYMNLEAVNIYKVAIPCFVALCMFLATPICSQALREPTIENEAAFICPVEPANVGGMYWTVTEERAWSDICQYGYVELEPEEYIDGSFLSVLEDQMINRPFFNFSTIAIYGGTYPHLIFSSKTFSKTLKFSDATFYGIVDFSNSRLRGGILLAGSSFEDRLYFGGVEVKGSISLSRSNFLKKVDFQYARIDGSLWGYNVGAEVGLFAGHANIGVSVDFSRSRNIEYQYTNELAEDGDVPEIPSIVKLGLRRSTMGELNVEGANIGVLDAQYSIINASADLSGTPVGYWEGGVWVDTAYARTEIDEAWFGASKVGGHIILSGADVKNLFDCPTCQIVGSVIAKSSDFESATSYPFKTKTMSFNSAVVGKNFLVNRSEIEEIDAAGISIGGGFYGNSGEIKTEIEGRPQAVFGSINLRTANIQGNLDLSGSRVNRLNGSGVSVGGNVRFKTTNDDLNTFTANANTFDLSDSSIGRDVIFSGVEIDMLDMESSNIGGGLYLSSVGEGEDRTRNQLGTIGLRGAHIARTLSLDETTVIEGFEGDRLNASAIHTADSDINELSLAHSRITSQLFFTNSKLSGLIRFSGAKIGELGFSSSDTNYFSIGSKLDLRASEIRVLTSSTRAFEIHGDDKDTGYVPIYFSGASIDTLGFRSSDDRPSMLNQKAEDVLDWIKGSVVDGNNLTYDPSHYKVIGNAFLKEGINEVASEIFYESQREKDRQVAGFSIWRWLNRSIVGYGVYPERAIVAFILIVVSGFIATFFSREGSLRHIPRKGLYSLDNSISLIENLESTKQVNHGIEWLEWFFLLQKIGGFVVISVLLGSLAGLF